MKRNGRTVNKTARYTEAQVHRVIKEQIGPMLQRTTRSIHEIHEMAFKDYILQHCPRIDIRRAIIDYNALVEKYVNDKEAGEFTDRDVYRYNRELPENDQT